MVQSQLRLGQHGALPPGTSVRTHLVEFDTFALLLGV